MKVMFRTTATGPDAHFISGKVYELTPTAAKPFLDGEYAHEVTADEKGNWVKKKATERPSDEGTKKEATERRSDEGTKGKQKSE